MNTIKKERFDFRLDEKLKQELEEAAGLLSVPLSVFVTEAIRERAARVINEHRRLQSHLISIKPTGMKIFAVVSFS